MSHARDVTEVVIKALVDEPDQVRVIETDQRGTAVVEVFVADGDMGRVIGRQGRTATAIRTLVMATADHHAERVSVEFRDGRGRR